MDQRRETRRKRLHQNDEQSDNQDQLSRKHIGFLGGKLGLGNVEWRVDLEILQVRVSYDQIVHAKGIAKHLPDLSTRGAKKLPPELLIRSYNASWCASMRVSIS